MCQILVKATNHTHPDSDKDQRGSYKRGYCVVVRDDDHIWGNLERMPKFALLKIPGISVAKAEKYVLPDEEEMDDGSGTGENKWSIVRRRLWKLRWDDLPQGAKDKLLADGFLVIKAGSYDGPFDYTWTQVKQFFRNQRTNQDETEDL